MDATPSRAPPAVGDQGRAIPTANDPHAPTTTGCDAELAPARGHTTRHPVQDPFGSLADPDGNCSIFLQPSQGR